MILFAALFTLLLLCSTEALVRSRLGYGAACLACCVLAVVPGMFCLGSLFPAFNSLLVLFVALACGYAGASPRAFRRFALAASGFAYLVVFIHTARYDDRDYSDLRERYPYESVADRLSYEPRSNPPAPGVRTGRLRSQPGAARLKEVEDNVVEKRDSGRRNWHLRQIHELHANVVERFISSPGFGSMRRIGPSEWTLRLDEVDAVPLLPEEDYFKRQREGGQSAPVGNQGRKMGSGSDESRLWDMHRGGLLDFVNPQGFGYIKDRDHVAGFQPHRFTEMPSNPKVQSIAWEVRSVELVSLLKHDPPAVYLSKNLPRMEELRKAGTRPLDDFESGQLPALRRGEDLMVSATTNHMRVLGAIRAGKPCLSCHDAERGDLLGAFSYKLRRQTPTTAP